MFAKKEKPEKKDGFIKRLRARLNKGDSWLTYDLANLAPGGKIDEDVLEELEAELVDPAARRQVREVVGQPAVAAVQASAQPLDEAVFLLGLFFLRKHGYTFLSFPAGRPWPDAARQVNTEPDGCVL